MVTKVGLNVEKVFKKYDTDGNGFIDCQELRALFTDLHCTLSEKELQDVKVDLDKNGDGKIDFEEFSLWFLASKKRLEGPIYHHRMILFINYYLLFIIYLPSFIYLFFR